MHEDVEDKRDKNRRYRVQSTVLRDPDVTLPKYKRCVEQNSSANEESDDNRDNIDAIVCKVQCCGIQMFRLRKRNVMSSRTVQ